MVSSPVTKMKMKTGVPGGTVAVHSSSPLDEVTVAPEWVVVSSPVTKMDDDRKMKTVVPVETVAVHPSSDGYLDEVTVAPEEVVVSSPMWTITG